ncbi:MAG: MFS transporter [Actinomycetota bacterium]
MKASETRASEGSPEFSVAPQSGGSLLRERNFRLFFFGMLISNSGTFLQSVSQGVLVYGLSHHSNFMVGVTQAAVFVPVLLLALQGGSLADRFDRRWLLIATQVLALAATGTLAVIVATGHASVPAVMVVAVLVGIQYAVAIPTMQALLPAFVDPRRLGEAIGLNSVTFNLARVIGPAISTVLISVSFGLAFGLNSLSFLALIAALLLIKFNRPTRGEGGPRSVREGLAYAWRNPRTRIILAAVLTLSLAIDPMITLAPDIARNVFHRPRQDAGLFLAAFGFGSMCAAFLFVRILRSPSQERYRNAPWLMALFAGGVIAFSWMPSIWLALAVLAVGELGFLTSTTTWTTGLQEEVSEAMRGRIMGIWTLCALGSRPLAALIDGAVADWAGPRVASLVIALPLVIVAAFVSPRLRGSASSGTAEGRARTGAPGLP